ncbi:hypothetical protein [Geopsychrobacter electrodiphilus]|uniref:hypothetical protein n=1 Tax=Geopsychrobacter electrodiphilus TaxID=225196 RepID=UPI000364CB90|nr:hypothetical protein [Geopsychrobacter electrodiphilus]
MKRVAGGQPRQVNHLEGRSGTLGEGRFKSSPLENSRYLLASCRYVEMNPGQVGLYDDPADHPWSQGRPRKAEK